MGGPRGCATLYADYRWRTTVAYCVIAFFRSAVQKMTGPALVPIGRQVGVDEADIGALGFATAASGCGYVLGAAVAGPLVDWLPGRQHGIVAIAVVIEAASTMLIPFATRLPVVAALLFIDGVGNGAMLPALTVSLVWIWGRDVGPKMQLFSAMFLGTVVSTAAVGLDLELTGVAETSDSGQYKHAFWGISAGQLVFCALPPLFMTAPMPPKHQSASRAAPGSAVGEEEERGLVRADAEHHSDDTSDDDTCDDGQEGQHNEQSHSSTPTSSAPTLDSKRSRMVVGHAGFIVFAYCIAESAIGTWLATFVFVKGLADESVAALFVSAFWGGLVASRFLAIWAAGRLRGETLIFLCFSLAATSIALGFVVLPYLFAGAPPQWILWAATAFYGFGCGPIFGACNSLPAQHGARVTGAQMTLLQLGVSCGNTVGPFVASRAFKIEALGGVGSLPYVVLAAVCLGLLALFSLGRVQSDG